MNEGVFLRRVCRKEVVLWRHIVSNVSRSVDAPERSQLMLLRRRVENVINRDSPGDDGVGDKRAMAAPRHRLGTHDRCRLERGDGEQIVERFAELARLHVVGVSAEAGVAPLGVVRITPAATASAEGGYVSVSAPAVDDRALQIWLRKVGIPRRCGEGAHIDQMCRAFSRQQSLKLLERPGRMPDRKK